jgi:hypothetical protein
MWASIAIVFVIALVAVSFAAGGAWLIVAVPLALVVLAPAAVLAFRRRVAAAGSLRREREQAKPAIRHAREAEDTVQPPQAPVDAPGNT